MKKNQTPAMFTRIAGKYDLLNHLLSLNVDRLWRRELVRTTGVSSGAHVLDACTGTADVAIKIASTHDDVRVVGVDLSAGMLEIGRHKVRRAGAVNGRVELLEGDVLALPFRDESFDAVTIAFGLRNLPDYQAGIQEMTRVLRAGGRLVVLEFSPPTNAVYLRAYRFYLKSVLPIVGGLVSGSHSAYRYLADSVDEFLTSVEISSLMLAAGLRDIGVRRLTGGVTYLHSGRK